MSIKLFCPFNDKPCMEDACMFWGVIDIYQTQISVSYGTDALQIPKLETEEGCLIKKAVKRYTR